jgi:hypothetical protein
VEYDRLLKHEEVRERDRGGGGEKGKVERMYQAKGSGREVRA